MVVGGAARVRFGSGAFVLNAGEGMFINAEALHAFDIVGNEGCRMISLVLDYNMLAGREDSVFARRYVMPVSYTHLDVYKRQARMEFHVHRRHDAGGILQ